MNVCYIAPFSTDFPATTASSIHMVRMCQALAENGNDVTLICSNKKISKNIIDEFYGINSMFSVIGVSSSLPKINRVFYSYKSVSISEKIECDIVVTRNGMVPFFANYRGISFVFDSHGPVWEKNIVEKNLFRWSLKSHRFKKMTTNSKALKEMYQENGWVPLCGIDVANNGADTLVDNNESFPLKGNYSFNVGYTGHLYSGRGIDIVIECAKRLPDYGFHIIGGNEEDVSFWRKEARISNLFFYGFVKPSILPNTRSSFDVLLAPYQNHGVAVAGGKGDTSKYMNPIKVIEYLSSSKAIIASDLPSIRDVVSSDNIILYVEPSNVEDWIESISKLRDDDLRKFYEKNVSEFFNNGMTWNARARSILK